MATYLFHSFATIQRKSPEVFLSLTMLFLPGEILDDRNAFQVPFPRFFLALETFSDRKFS
jgi:hypothetical protein